MRIRIHSPEKNKVKIFVAPALSVDEYYILFRCCIIERIFLKFSLPKYSKFVKCGRFGIRIQRIFIRFLFCRSEFHLDPDL